MNLAAEITAWRAPASLGLLVVLLLWETLHPFFGLFDRGRRRLIHALGNIGLGVVNALAIRFVFLGLWVRIMEWTAAHGVGLLHWLALPGWARWTLAVMLLDLWTYAWHRLNHTVPFFWRFHRLHHSDAQMDVTTANRFHLGEITFSSLLRVPVFVLVGCRLEELALYELLLFACVQFHHANIGLPEWLDRALRSVIVTPALHKVHHSVVLTEQNSNFSSLLSWWDRLAATLRLAPDLRRIVFGVNPRG
jgi:sterol desaturase/sphingolipid hydroxylase (fatty acid hydroxylase superfamily)